MVLAAATARSTWHPGLDVQQTLPFRDKERMKQVLDAAGIRTPRHVAANSAPPSAGRQRRASGFR